MDECTGNLIMDTSGFFRNGIAHGSPTWNILANGPLTSNQNGYAVFGCGLSFSSGSSQYLNFSSSKILPIAADGWSWGAWIRTSTTSTAAMIAEGYQNSEDGFELYMTSGDYNCAVRDSTHGSKVVTSSSTYNDGDYHHVYCAFSSGSSLTLWVDGTNVASSSTTVVTTSADKNSNLYICHDDAGNYCTANVDEARMYLENLQQDKITQLYDTYPYQSEVAATFLQPQEIGVAMSAVGSTYPLYYTFLGTSFNQQGTEASAQMYAPRPAEIYGLHVRQTSGTCTTLAITLRSGGADTALKVNSAGNTNTVSDTTDVVTVSAGSLIDWKISGTCSATQTFLLTADVVWGSYTV